MIPFRYFSFWDVPRSILLRHRGRLLYLRSAFDEELDEYPVSYVVYALPDSVEAEAANGVWTFLNSLGPELGRVPITAVEFDPTRRKFLDDVVLDQFIG